MSARIPISKRSAVVDALARGQRMKDVAVTTGVSMRTVRRIHAEVAAEIETSLAPAAALSMADMRFLRAFIDAHEMQRCPRCDQPMLLPLSKSTGQCDACAAPWSIRSSVATAGETARRDSLLPTVTTSSCLARGRPSAPG